MYADMFAKAEWWVVYVRSAGQRVGCHYGGQAATVSRWIADHAGWAGPVEELVPYPFDSAHASLQARHELDAKLYESAALTA